MNQPRILIVEDEAIVSLDIEQGLKNSGYEVVSIVDTGEDAIRVVKEHKPDLVLMDIVLKSKMDGIEAASQIRDRFNIPVIYLTAHADEATLQRARVTTPYGYILKPFEEAELKPAVELALDRFRAEHSQSTRTEPFSYPVGQENLNGAEVRTALDVYEKVKPFSSLPEETRQRLASLSQIKPIKAGEYVAYEGDDDASTFLVVTGRVLMLKSSSSGKELILDFVPPGDIFPLAIALEKESYPLSAKTQIDSKLLFVPKSAMAVVLEEFPQAYRDISEQIVKRLRDSMDMSRRLAHDRVEVRIAAALLGLRDRLGGAVNEEEETFVLELTRKELADLTGTTPETASRVSKALESAGLLDLTQAGIVIVNSREGLEDLVYE
ncbi:MAG: response regulator [Bdellovibrionales bacterium]|nr:response regulator [Bdellovibrionales bacterium]